jgi:mannose-6-phosphate isomerase-like protein (cupin superfamily)
MYYGYVPPPYNTPYNPYNMYTGYSPCPCPYWPCEPMYKWGTSHTPIPLKDYGPQPYVVDIEEATEQNNTFRTALWTGTHLQLTLMSIPAGQDVGLEVHPELDQFIRIEEGQGLTQMGDTKETLDFQKNVYADDAIFIPAGKWHNLINTGYQPLKLYSIYAPPEHPWGTVHKTKADAEEAKKHHRH